MKALLIATWKAVPAALRMLVVGSTSVRALIRASREL
jgi:hypothetical protein